MRALLVPLYLLQSIGLILSSPRLFSKCLIPFAIGIASFVITVAFGLYYRADITNFLYHFDTNWLQFGLEWIVSFFIILFCAFISYITTSLLGSLYYETITIDVMKTAGLKEVADDPSFVKALLRGTVHELYKLIFIGTLSISTFIPILAPLALPISFYLIAFEYFDLPLQLQGHSFSYRVKVITKNLTSVLMLGAITTALFLIPLGALLFTPFLHATAIKSLAKWEESNVLKTSPSHS